GGINSGYFITTGSKNTILGNYTGNNGGLDIRTANNYIVLSDGDGNWRWANRAGTEFIKASNTGSWVASSWVTVRSNVTSLGYFLEITAYGYENGIVNSGINNWLATYSSASGWTLVKISEATAGNTYGTPVLRFTGDTLETQGLTSVSTGRWFVFIRAFTEAV
ncbi:MAG: hypothetical protein EBR82_83075, partial [Caulobacteraceae bacterium]|nr:hypothetical protein [Caulobacteraceae bacterium]